jgi:hypothetical protein
MNDFLDYKSGAVLVMNPADRDGPAGRQGPGIWRRAADQKADG